MTRTNKATILMQDLSQVHVFAYFSKELNCIKNKNFNMYYMNIHIFSS